MRIGALLGGCTALLLLVAACGGGGTTEDAGGTDLGGGEGGARDLGGVDFGGDTGCTTDDDSDGHRSYACGGDDCDDTDPNRYPGNPEHCDTLGHDEDCDPMTLGPDADSDSFVSTSCCDTQPDGTLACGQDCDDARATVNPSAVESCNGIDDDCDGTIDDHDVLTTFYRDLDGDAHGDPAMTMTGCSAPLGYVLENNDCDDAHANVHPGLPDGPTANCDGLDNDCDGTPDRGCPCVDGTTQPCGLSSTAPCHLGTQTCAGAAWGACIGAVDPMPETCNSIDDDCNGIVDDGARVDCYTDGDHDGYAPMGATLMMVCADSTGHCPTGFTATAPLTASATDCNDAQATVHPGAIENCNMVDDDCDGVVDDGAGTVQYRDADGDGHGAGAMVLACVLMSGYSTANDDCNDGDATFHPGAPEVCDGLDENCDGVSDFDAPESQAWCLGLPNTTATSGAAAAGLGMCEMVYVGGSSYAWACGTGTYGSQHFTCAYGWSDCESTVVLSGWIFGANGCESSVTTDSRCGECTRSCVPLGQHCSAGLTCM